MRRKGTSLRRGVLLSEIVRDYRAGAGRNRAAGFKRFRELPSLADAINQAALARRADGKCEAHQRRVGIVALRPFERKLQRAKGALEGAATFHELYEIVEANRTHRVGALTVYDTAVRIGAYLGLAPTKVYLHTGTRAGARVLGLPIKDGYLDPAQLPGALGTLEPDEAEDCLCIYKDWFAGAAETGGQCARPRCR